VKKLSGIATDWTKERGRWKCRIWQFTDQIARVEDSKPDKDEPNDRDGKCKIWQPIIGIIRPPTLSLIRGCHGDNKAFMSHSVVLTFTWFCTFPIVYWKTCTPSECQHDRWTLSAFYIVLVYGNRLQCAHDVHKIVILLNYTLIRICIKFSLCRTLEVGHFVRYYTCSFTRRRHCSRVGGVCTLWAQISTSVFNVYDFMTFFIDLLIVFINYYIYTYALTESNALTDLNTHDNLTKLLKYYFKNLNSCIDARVPSKLAFVLRCTPTNRWV